MPEARAVGSLSGSLTANMHSLAARTAISAVLGGTAEQLGGGKFANGAITGAYTVMFNHFLHDDPPKNGEIYINENDKTTNIIIPNPINGIYDGTTFTNSDMLSTVEELYGNSVTNTYL